MAAKQPGLSARTITQGSTRRRHFPSPFDMDRQPSPIQVTAALETLRAAGWSLTPPVSERVRLMTPDDVATAIGCGLAKARDIIRALPRSVRLPGDDLRARPDELDAWLDAHNLERSR